MTTCDGCIWCTLCMGSATWHGKDWITSYSVRSNHIGTWICPLPNTGCGCYQHFVEFCWDHRGFRFATDQIVGYYWMMVDIEPNQLGIIWHPLSYMAFMRCWFIRWSRSKYSPTVEIFRRHFYACTSTQWCGILYIVLLQRRLICTTPAFKKTGPRWSINMSYFSVRTYNDNPIRTRADLLAPAVFPLLPWW